MIYLDHNATTPLAPGVLERMHPFLSGTFGNASSVHALGQVSRHAIDDARETLAESLGARARDLTLTSGGTEANALAVLGTWMARRREANRIVVTAVEHPAVLQAAEQAEHLGAEVVRIGVDAQGALDLDALKAALEVPTAVASVMWVNNETGVIHPVGAVAELCREAGAPLHLDAVQAFGKIPVDVEAIDAQLLSISAHKVGGPKGAGALWTRKGVEVAPLQPGHQERGKRGGTENVAAIVGFAHAAQRRPQSEGAGIEPLRDRLEAALLRIEGTLSLGATQPRVNNTSTVCFSGLDGEALLMALDLEGICVSAGSACSSGSLEPSHVLKAMKVPDAFLRGAIRFSLGADNTAAQIAEVISVVERSVASLRRER